MIRNDNAIIGCCKILFSLKRSAFNLMNFLFMRHNYQEAIVSHGRIKPPCCLINKCYRKKSVS